ncbi:ubiquinol-cytochrome-c reductase complex assembly factor 3 isoform X1 [Narcine bancroftii]|uniref:ubiquinol-cytochrome-c reductase complex assembly factor 3 isoform X1 n=1 Tax=Narcine bancroftii TaxID=1343680 RepID=UPI003831E8F6
MRRRTAVGAGMSSRGLATSVGALLAVGAGWVSWLMVGPSERRTVDLSKHLPESNTAQWEERRRQNALVMEAIKRAAESNKNVASQKDWNQGSQSDH